MLYVYIGAGLLVLVFFLSLYIVRTIFFPNKFTLEKCKEVEMEKGFFDDTFLQDKTVKDVYINNDGLKLYAKYVDNQSNKTLIIMHGYTYTHYGSYKYLKPFLKNNYNILMPDQRHHGNSEGRNTTLGGKEHLDLRAWISYIKEINPSNQVIGLHGESMGAATVLLEGHNEAVDFVISDCAFSTFQLQVEEHLWKFNRIPSFFVHTASLVGKLLYGAPITSVRPVDNVKNIKAPILLIHGSVDHYITITHFEQLKNETTDKDTIYLCEGADHAESYQTNPSRYDEIVTKFLADNNMI